jgi:hypothetical protein
VDTAEKAVHARIQRLKIDDWLQVELQGRTLALRVDSPAHEQCSSPISNFRCSSASIGTACFCRSSSSSTRENVFGLRFHRKECVQQSAARRREMDS